MPTIITLQCSTGLITPRSKFPDAVRYQFTVLINFGNGVWSEVMSTDNQHIAESQAHFYVRSGFHDAVILDNTK